MSKKTTVSLKSYEMQARQLATARAELELSEAQLAAIATNAAARDAAVQAAPPVAAPPPPPPSLRAQLQAIKAKGDTYASMAFIATHADLLLAEVDAERKGAA